MRGGRSARRDRWFGLDERPDFGRFRRWWHRVAKDEAAATTSATVKKPNVCMMIG
jgi:hypothetical protein